MDTYADCLAGFLRKLRIEQAHLFGLSFGAALVLAAFHRHRELALSLTLVSGYAGWLGSLGKVEADQRLARSLVASRLAPDAFVAAMAPSMFSPSADGDRWASAGHSRSSLWRLVNRWVIQPTSRMARTQPSLDLDSQANLDSQPLDSPGSSYGAPLRADSVLVA